MRKTIFTVNATQFDNAVVVVYNPGELHTPNFKNLFGSTFKYILEANIEIDRMH